MKRDRRWWYLKSGQVIAMHGAKVDDCLIRAARARERAARLTRRAAAARLDADGLRRLARQMRGESPRAASLLVDLLFDEGAAEAESILSLLSEMPDPEAVERVERLLERDDLEDEARARLERARDRLREALGTDGSASAGVELSGPELWRRAAGPRWSELSPPALGKLWLRRLYPLAISERQAVLEETAREWEAAPSPARPAGAGFPLAAVAEMEAHWGGRAMGRWIAKFLGGQRDSFSSDALRRLAASHRDAAARAIAASALEKAPALPAPPEPPDRLERCYASGFLGLGPAAAAAAPSQGLAGQGSLLLVRLDPAGQTRYALLMVDLAERGLVECWGDEGAPLEEFGDFLAACNRAESADPFERIPVPLAVMAANAAAAATLRGGYVLPKEYFFWRDIFASEPCEARQYKIILGGADGRGGFSPKEYEALANFSGGPRDW